MFCAPNSNNTGVCLVLSLASKFGLWADVHKKMIHFRSKFLKIGAQSGIVLSPMGDQGCGVPLSGNANVTNTPPHIRGPMGKHMLNSGRNASWW